MPGLIFASHILPWTVDVDEETGDESLVPRGRHSSLFATSAKFAKHHVGIINSCKPETLREFHRLKLNPVQVPKDIAFGHYEGYCKLLLWPLFHGYLDTIIPTGSNRNWPHYVTVNQMIADEIVRLYEEGDTIWVNDYHLLLVPQFVRSVLPRAQIAFFLHTPFPY
jgi:trehalose-6-phosphate synthase